MANDNVSSISKAQTYEEMADFWDTHSVADYADSINTDFHSHQEGKFYLPPHMYHIAQTR